MVSQSDGRGYRHNTRVKVELHEASPRLGRVMGIGQETEEDHQEDTTEDQLAVEPQLAPGKPWPVAREAKSSVRQPSTLTAFTLIGLFCLKKLS